VALENVEAQNKMKKVIITSLLFVSSLIGNDLWDGKVYHAGALKNAMKKGDLTPKIELSELKNIPHLYALGAVGYLKGEVQIFDSKSYTTFVKNGKVEFDYTFQRNASLLVYASVPSWKGYKIPDSIKTRKQFEEYIEEKAEEHGLDMEKPFPFIIEGEPTLNDWHVIDWDPNEKVHTHQKHVESGVHERMTKTPIKMLGFFSYYHSGVFTHHTTSLHIHFITHDKKIAGHSDNMELGAGMILKLPKIKEEVLSYEGGSHSKGLAYYKYLFKDELKMLGTEFTDKYKADEWKKKFENNGKAFKEEFAVTPKLKALMYSDKFDRIAPHLLAFTVYYAHGSGYSPHCGADIDEE
jgi:acetolactate decarboxylase